MRGVSEVRKRTKAKKEKCYKVLQKQQEKYKCIFHAQNTFGQTKSKEGKNKQRRIKGCFPSDSSICGLTAKFP